MVRLYARSLARALLDSVCIGGTEQKWVNIRTESRTPSSLHRDSSTRRAGKPNLLLLLLLLLVGAAAAAASYTFFVFSFTFVRNTHFSSSSSIFVGFVPPHTAPCVRISLIVPASSGCCALVCSSNSFRKYTLRCSVRDDEKPCLLCSTLSFSLSTAATCVPLSSSSSLSLPVPPPLVLLLRHTQFTRSEVNESFAVWWSSAVTTDSVSPSWICYEIQNGGRFIFY